MKVSNVEKESTCIDCLMDEHLSSKVRKQKDKSKLASRRAALTTYCCEQGLVSLCALLPFH